MNKKKKWTPLTLSDICVAISAYNCKDELIRCIQSIPKEIFVLVCDGAFLWGNRRKPKYSTDGTYDVLEILDRDGVTYAYSGTQMEKRQKIADTVGNLEFKVMFIIDSDEYIHDKYNDWNGFLAELNKYCPRYPDGYVFDVWLFVSPKYDRGENIFDNLSRYEVGFINKPRVWYMPSNLEYHDTHWWVRRKNAVDKNEQLFNKITLNESIALDMDSSLRTPEFLKERLDRQRPQVRRENKIVLNDMKRKKKL